MQIIHSNKNNLLQLTYEFQKILLLQEPLLLVGAFYLLFVIVIIYVRLDFSITKVTTPRIIVLTKKCSMSCLKKQHFILFSYTYMYAQNSRSGFDAIK